MELPALERRLRCGEGAAVVLTDARLLSRVIKRHRHLFGIGLHVPHARAYVVSRELLLSIVEPDELGRPRESLPAEVILVPKPEPEELAELPPEELLRRLWRAVFHAEVHRELERRVRENALSEAALRRRVHRVGQTEIDEIRAVLRQDELLLPPQDDREVYIELCAIWLELKRFEPALLARMFPGLHDLQRVEALIAADVDAEALLARCRPEGAALPSEPLEGADEASARAARKRVRRRPSREERARRCEAARDVRARGNVVRSALLHLSARAFVEPAEEEALLAEARADLGALSLRLEAALGAATGGGEHARALDGRGEAWPALLLPVAEEASAGVTLRTTLEARFLHDLQQAAVAHERPQRAVDLIGWIRSLGRRKVVRDLPKSAPLRVVRSLRRAQRKLPALALAPAERRALSAALHHAMARAEERVREALRPALLDALAAVGLVPADAPERVARQKLVEELLDAAIAQGFLGIGQLRDALSRNQLKLPALRGPSELLFGDALLLADRRLEGSLDGVYRRGEIYLRLLQKVSSLAFGTGPGRLAVLYLALPFGSAYVLLEGLSHIVGPISEHLGHGHVHLLTRPSFALTGLVLFALLHSAALRGALLASLRALGAFLHTIFVRFPRWLARLPAVRAVLLSRPVRWTWRYGLRPSIPAALLWLHPALREGPRALVITLALGIFALVSVLLNSRAGLRAEELVLDWSSRRWRFVRHRLAPGLVRLFLDVFKAVLEALERGIYRIDEWLRFRQGEGRLALVAKGALGVIWFFVAYLVRIYINLLVEPQINPIKHFPVVTVAAKILVPMSPGLIRGLDASLAPLVGDVVAASIAGPTVLLLPGFFGFLIWELKENWKLYRASRPEELHPLSIGHHGETMGALMKPGFHSGTLPKLHEKLRRAARKGLASAAKYEEGLLECEEAVRRFVDRELVALLASAKRFRAGPIAIHAVILGSNQVRIELVCPALGGEPCALTFEEQSGSILAGVAEAGFLDALGETDRAIVENALAGLYRFAGADIVREQLEAALRRGDRVPEYDIAEEGLVVWPRRSLRGEVVYDLRKGPRYAPVIRGEVPAEAATTLREDEVFFRHHALRWSSWVEAWRAASEGEGPIPRVIEGASLLPPRAKA
jgi:hypothetical protein